MRKRRAILWHFSRVQQFLRFRKLYAESIDKLDYTERAEDGRPILDFHEALFSISRVLWQHPEVIDEYIAESDGSSIAAEDRDAVHLTEADSRIILSWKQFISGKFAVVEHHANGSTLIDVETNNVYRVKGITDPIEILVRGFNLPVIIQTTLLPFKDVIVTSGHVGIVQDDNGASYNLDEILLPQLTLEFYCLS